MQGARARGEGQKPPGGPGFSSRSWWAYLLASACVLLIFSQTAGIPQRFLTFAQQGLQDEIGESKEGKTAPAQPGDQKSLAALPPDGDVQETKEEEARPSGHSQKAQPTASSTSGAPSQSSVEVLGEQVAFLSASSRSLNPMTDFGTSEETYYGEGKAEGVRLPEISPVAGVSFVETMIGLLDHELNERFLGWRPNDILIGRLTDNVNNFQLGVLEALRFTTLRLKDSLTRLGEADSYDPDLEQALAHLMISPTRFMFPSAENSYSKALKHLNKFIDKLESGERSFYYRKDTLLALMGTYRDLLGNVNNTLVASPVGWFETDDQFYYAKGVAHVYYEILKVVRVGFETPLENTLYGIEMMDQILHQLDRVEEMNPWYVMNSSLDGIFANHRANLNAPLSEVLHLMGVMGRL